MTKMAINMLDLTFQLEDYVSQAPASLHHWGFFLASEM